MNKERLLTIFMCIGLVFLLGCEGDRLPVYTYEVITIDKEQEYLLCVDEMRFVDVFDWHHIKYGEQFGESEYNSEKKKLYRIVGDDDFNFIMREGSFSRPPALMVRKDITLPEIGADVPNKITYLEDLTNEYKEISMDDLTRIYEGNESMDPLVIVIYNFRPLYLELYFDKFPGVYYSIQITLTNPKRIERADKNGRFHYELTIDQNTAGDILKAIGAIE